MKKGQSFPSILLIQIAIGVYFSMTGILGIMNFGSQSNELQASLNNLFGSGETNYAPLVFGILFLLVGFILIVGVIANIKNQALYYGLFILWVVYLIITYFTNDFMKPTAINWLTQFSSELIILAGLWGTTQRK